MTSTNERFWAKVDKESDPDGCWLWTASLMNGYGSFYDGIRCVRAHRYSYELLIGPIPEGLVLDHLCRVKCCVNPSHLEPVTNRENTLRGEIPSRTHCIHGHPFDESNTYRRYGRERVCRTCRKRQNREMRARQRARAAPPVVRPRVACPSCGGHGLVGVWVGDYEVAECNECGGLGELVVYPNDALALWPGGPMRGSWPGKYAELVEGGKK